LFTEKDTDVDRSTTGRLNALLPPVLIAGAGTAIGLAIARGLRDTGVPIVGASLTPTAPTCRSKLWHSVLQVSAPTTEAWLATLRAAHARYGPMVLFPADDTVVRIVAEHAGELATQFHFVLPDLPTVDRLLDKSVFHEWALANDFPVPHTAIVHNPGQLRAALREMAFPVVFKPVERTPQWQDFSKYGTAYRLESADDFERLPFAPFNAADRFVVQEWIPGRDSDVYFCLTYRNRNGEELAAQGGRKITQWRVDTGSTALAVTHQDAELHKLTRRLLDTAGHVGFGSLEVRRSTRDGRMLITEPTVGRPDLQTALAAAAGVNLVDMAYRDALKLPAPPSRPSREAIWIHETAFPRSVLVAARRRRLDGRTLLAALRTRRTPTGAFFSDRDPLPLVLETAKVANKILRAALIIGRRRPKPPLITRRGGLTWLSWRARFSSATRTHPVGWAQTDGVDPQDRGTPPAGFDDHHLQPGANGDGDHDGHPLLANSSWKVTTIGNGTYLPSPASPPNTTATTGPSLLG
jgi:predicted ATP-grasp superfamily ATP-dependent carboligase